MNKQQQASPLAIVIAIVVLLVLLFVIYKLTVGKGSKPGGAGGQGMPTNMGPGGNMPGMPGTGAGAGMPGGAGGGGGGGG